MSLRLNLGTRPYGTEVKTLGLPGQDYLIVSGPGFFKELQVTGVLRRGVAEMRRDRAVVPLAGCRLSIEDYLYVLDYVLTNTNLYDDDPRLAFIDQVLAEAPTEKHRAWFRKSVASIRTVKGFFSMPGKKNKVRLSAAVPPVERLEEKP
jgi:molybdopterin biosynthesis enzyme MoaB